MKIIINTKEVKIIEEEKITSGGFNDNIVEVEFSEEYKSLATFITFNNIKRMVIGNKVNMPTLEEGVCQIGAYGIESVNDETILRYSPQPAYIQVKKGSYNNNLTDPKLPTQSEYEAMIALINQAIEDGKLKGDKGDKGDRGEQGPPGDVPNIDENTTTSIVLSDNTVFKRNTIMNLSVSAPNNTYINFASMIVFNSGNTATKFSFNGNCKFIGDEVENNIFTPVDNKTYELRFWNNGINLNCVVWGVE